MCAPRGDHAVQAQWCNAAYYEQAARVARVDRWRIILPEQVHLTEQHALPLLCELNRLPRDLTAQLVAPRMPVQLVDAHQHREPSRAPQVSQELQAEAP